MSDSNAGTGSHGAIVPLACHAYAVELYEPVLKGDVVIGFRPVEFTNNGSGTLRHFGNFDIGLHDPHNPHNPHLYATMESAFNASSAGPLPAARKYPWRHLNLTARFEFCCS